MKSVRLDAETEERLREAARVTGRPMSVLIREAIEKQCNAVLGQRLSDRLSDVIGSVASGEPTNASEVSTEFGRILQRKGPDGK